MDRATKRMISLLMAIALALALIPGYAGAYAAEDGHGGYRPEPAVSFDLDAYIQELSELVRDNWSDDYISTVEFVLYEPEMTVNGETVLIDPYGGAAPFLSGEGSAMLPVRALSEVLDLDVEYGRHTERISISGGDIEVELMIDSTVMTVNGEPVALESAPEIRGGSAFVPACAVAEGLLFEVGSIDDEGRVVLTKPFQTMRLIAQTDGTPPGDLVEIAGLTHSVEGPDNMFILQFESEMAAKEAMEALEGVTVFCEPDSIVTVAPLEVADVSYEPYSDFTTFSSGFRSWGVARIGADRYINYLNHAGNLPEVIVAVIDSGVDLSHPHFYGRLVPGRNVMSNNDDTQDSQWHGTAISGVIAEATPDNVKIMPVRFMDLNQFTGAVTAGGTESLAHAGIVWAVANKANVLNLSFGTEEPSEIIKIAVTHAYDNNVVVVAAAGNAGKDAGVVSPASAPEAITVAASTSSDMRADFNNWASNWGTVIDVSAPGASVTTSNNLTLRPGNPTRSVDGTSIAAPHVAAAIALLMSDVRFAGYGPRALKEKLHELTDDAGTQGFDVYFGHGIVNLAKAGLLVNEPTPEAEIDYMAEELTGLNGTHSINGTTYNDIPGSLTIDEAWIGHTISIVKVGDDYFTADSAVQLLAINARPAMPTGIVGENETAAYEGDGRVTGVTEDMEFSEDGGSSWTGVSGTEIPDLTPGTYLVRLKATNSDFAGAAVAVPIGTGVAPTILLSVGAPSFSDVAFNYVRPGAQTLVISNTGNTAAAISDVTLSNEIAFELIAGTADVPPGGFNDNWMVQPIAGLTAGVYSVVVTVNYDSGESATATLHFTVNKAIPSITRVPTASNVRIGDRLSASTLSGGAANVPGVFAWATPDAMVLAAGEHRVRFTPADTANFEIYYLPDPVPLAVDTGNVNGDQTTGSGGFPSGGGGGAPEPDPTPTPEPTPDPSEPGTDPEPGEVVVVPFGDVPSGVWYFEAVHFVQDQGLFQGTGEGTFSPGLNMTRAMFVTVLGRLAEQMGVRTSGFSHRFDDVPSGQWYSQYIMWAASIDVVSGYSDSVFGLNDNVSREQMAVLFVRFAEHMGIDLPAGAAPAFGDAGQVSGWAGDAVRRAAAAGLLRGYEDGTFRPHNTATRAEVATMFMRFAQDFIE